MADPEGIEPAPRPFPADPPTCKDCGRPCWMTGPCPGQAARQAARSRAARGPDSSTVIDSATFERLDAISWCTEQGDWVVGVNAAARIATEERERAVQIGERRIAAIEAEHRRLLTKNERLRAELTDLLDYTDRHRHSDDGHDEHDCYEEWTIIRDSARAALAHAESPAPEPEPEPTADWPVIRLHPSVAEFAAAVDACRLGLVGICRGEEAVQIWDDEATCARCMLAARAMANENTPAPEPQPTSPFQAGDFAARPMSGMVLIEWSAASGLWVAYVQDGPTIGTYGTCEEAESAVLRRFPASYEEGGTDGE